MYKIKIFKFSMLRDDHSQFIGGINPISASGLLLIVLQQLVEIRWVPEAAEPVPEPCLRFSYRLRCQFESLKL